MHHQFDYTQFTDAIEKYDLHIGTSRTQNLLYDAADNLSDARRRMVYQADCVIRQAENIKKYVGMNANPGSGIHMAGEQERLARATADHDEAVSRVQAFLSILMEQVEEEQQNQFMEDMKAIIYGKLIAE